ncbi:TPM domain-containing protein [Novosphingobium sp. SG720]|uniref:TPM domain-containing protein n=1 Tax=Novosphingobium sp. SG720 TaxID=2586998 RepID=UPI00144601C7|nr:TPM domain-containing protein [Novosphingobium sp. SG720]NKJ41239.1 uncharacterized protein [Novosphingobium sp. SG720]
MTRTRRFHAARLALILVALAAGASVLAWSIGQGHTDAASAPGAASAPVAITLAGRVTDAAHVLSPDEVAQLDRALGDFERRTGHQMVVVTAPGLGGADIATFTRALGNAWGIGRKGVDDGVIVLVAPAERQARIAVGDGLRSALSDADCATIMQQHMVPQFRAGHYGAGVIAAVAAIRAKLA